MGYKIVQKGSLNHDLYRLAKNIALLYEERDQLRPRCYRAAARDDDVWWKLNLRQ